MGLIPFPLISLVLYMGAALFFYDATPSFVETGLPAPHSFWDVPMTTVTLVSGQDWALTRADALLILALLLLLFSMLRAATRHSTTVLGNMTTVLTLCAYIILFLAVESAGTSLFFLLTMIALVDTLGTVAISLVASHSRIDAVPVDD